MCPARSTSRRCTPRRALLEGRHDFAAFQATGSSVATTEREIFESRADLHPEPGIDRPTLLCYE